MFWQGKTKVAEAFHTFGEEEMAELLPKIKTRRERQVIKALVHVKAMIMLFTLLLFRLVLPILLRRRRQYEGTVQSLSCLKWKWLWK